MPLLRKGLTGGMGLTKHCSENAQPDLISQYWVLETLKFSPLTPKNWAKYALLKPLPRLPGKCENCSDEAKMNWKPPQVEQIWFNCLSPHPDTSTAHSALSCRLSCSVYFPSPSTIYLSVVFSDSTLSNSCPLSCFQAWKNRCCLVLDSFLWLGTDVFMGWSVVFSQGAEPNIGFSAQKLQGRSPAAETKKKFEFRLKKQLFLFGVEKKTSGKNSDNSESAVSLYLLKITSSYNRNPKTPPKKT